MNFRTIADAADKSLLPLDHFRLLPSFAFAQEKPVQPQPSAEEKLCKRIDWKLRPIKSVKLYWPQTRFNNKSFYNAFAEEGNKRMEQLDFANALKGLSNYADGFRTG